MKKLTIVFLLIIVIALGIFIWWQHGKSPVNANDTSQKVFEIKKGENLRDVGFSLKNQGLIRDPIVFFLLIKQEGLDGKIQAGNFRISPSMSASDIAEALTHGTTDVWITIPEGLRATEIAEILKQKLPTYDSSWEDKLATQEGYLFPDTYLVPSDASIDTILSLMRNNFTKKYQEAAVDATTKLTEQQIVTLASIVQREAITENDMKLVASVLENRLSNNLPLGSDVTVEYALGYQLKEKTWWKKDLTADDLIINSLYNTRQVAGLPPTPISNPGLTALKATLDAPTTDYMYYVSDANGKLHFAKTLSEHNANVEKYMQ